MKLHTRRAQVEMFDRDGQQVGSAVLRAKPRVGEFTIPIDIFSQTHPLFIKLRRRSWFFDEAGWIEIPGTRFH
ncbi:MAG: hypothetical protein JO201_04430 [Verrucomicrobia bacterium]|nr:hypothetical protein [Verrucomicrobiota bacterium]